MFMFFTLFWFSCLRNTFVTLAFNKYYWIIKTSCLEAALNLEVSIQVISSYTKFLCCTYITWSLVSAFIIYPYLQGEKKITICLKYFINKNIVLCNSPSCLHFLFRTSLVYFKCEVYGWVERKHDRYYFVTRKIV